MGDHDTTSDSTRSTSPTGSQGSWSLSVGLFEKPGEWIGPYKLLEVLGEGGFGVVYLAERREPMVQRVALKIIKPGMDSRAVVARFEQERQALAVMDHPNVAKVFDGGVTPTGRPYFVMEHVHGEPITAYCDRHSLSIEGRLRIFQRVCDAVQHAHMKGIIHRDLKPSNILVTVKDGEPTAKVIDFGVAKAINHTLTDKTIFTETGHLIGTPEYMSPEQAEMGALDIDTRTDVYSLGIVLYELLTGGVPFDSATLRKAGYAEIQRIIRDEEPPRPSTRVSGLGDSANDIAKKRQSAPDELSRLLNRELEWVPLKAIRKDRTQRYQTPRELAEDVGRYLSGQPLVAGPESAAYRLKKFVRRNLGPVVAVGAVVLTLTAGLVATYSQYRRAERRAETERLATQAAVEAKAVAEEATEFVNKDMLEAVASHGGSEGDISLRVVEVLDAADGNASRRFADHPSVEIAVRSRLARAFTLVGNAKAAIRQVDRVFELDPTLRVSVDANAIELQMIRAESLYRERTPEIGIEECRTLHGRLVQALGPAHTQTLEAGNQLGNLLKWAGKYDEAEGVYREVARGRSRALGEAHVDTLITRHNLALNLDLQARALAKRPGITDADRANINDMLGRAIADLRAVVGTFSASVGPDHASALACRSELAAMIRRQKRYDEAEQLYRPLVASMQSVLGPSHWRALDAQGNFARTLMFQGKLTEARDILMTCFEGYRLRRGKTYADTLTIGTWLVQCLNTTGDLDSAKRVRELIIADLRSASADPERILEVEKQLDVPFKLPTPTKQ